MKKGKTGREVLGTRLFASEHRLGRYLQQLPRDAETYLRVMLKEFPTIDADELRAKLHANFDLHALEIHDLLSIRIELVERDYYNEYDCVQSGYLHEAIVPYSGSEVFWKVLPHSAFEFSFPGKIGLRAASIRGLLDGTDFEWFRDQVQKSLEAARKAWNDQAVPMVLLEIQTREMLDRVADAELAKFRKDALDV